MNTRKLIRTAGIVVAVLAVAGGVVAATAYAAGATPLAASTPTPTAKPSAKPANAYCDKFMQHLASNLKTSQSNVQSQIAKAAQQTVDDAVKAGNLTQAQGDAMKAKVNANAVCTGPLAALGRKPEARPAVFAQASLTAAATTVKMTPDQLKQQLALGKTLAQLAPQGMTQDQFKSQYIANLKSQLDAQVKAGKLTQTQEDQLLKAAPTMADMLWNHGRGTAAGARPAKPRPSPSPTT